MANQVTPLSLANTFGNWLVTTNQVLAETNDIGANNYIKDSGTLFINSTGTGLQIANDAIIQGSFQVTGTGSSATIQNNLTVSGQIRAANTTANPSGALGLRVDGTANIANLNITGAGVDGGGFSLVVANNTNIRGYVQANTGNVGTLSAVTSIIGNIITANNDLNAGSANIVNYLQANTGNVGTLSAVTRIVGGIITANSNLNAGSANIVGLMQSSIANVGTLSAVTRVISETITSNNVLNGNYANLNVVIATTSTMTGTITANGQLNAGAANVVGAIFGQTITANGQLNADSALGNIITANTDLNAGNLNVASYGRIATSLNVGSISANTFINTQTIYADTIVNARAIFANSSIETHDAQVNRNLTVKGNFVIEGTTIYDSDVLNLKGAAPLTGTAVASFGVNRQAGLPTFTPNAQIRFDNSDALWKIRDIANNSTTAAPNTYYEIVTTKFTGNTTHAGLIQLSNSNTSLSITQALSLAGANNLDLYISSTAAGANAVMNNRISANVATLRGEITANAASANSVINTRISANVATINGSITANADSANSVINTRISANVATINGSITANAVSTNSVINTANTNLKAYVDGTKVASVTGTTGNIVIGGTSTTPTIDLNNGLLTGGTAGSSTVVPVLRWDSSGRLTQVTTQSISGITVNGTSFSPGGSGTITAVNPNALTIGTGLSGGSYSGSSAVTIAIDSTVATLTGTQTLSNKTLTSPVLGTPSSGTLTNCTGLPIDGGTSGTLPVARGGTGATVASTARSNLGLAIGTDVPSPTGTGASGTWSINITGNAATASNASSISNAVGTTYTWTATQYFTGNGNTGSASSIGAQVYSTGGNGAIMAFHRSGSFAVNMGLDSDNIFRIGGWSASANRLQMDMSGNLTMAGDITAFSDENLKTNWRDLPQNLVELLSKVKVGVYDRIDNNNMTQVGVSAQSLQNVMPEAVSADANGILSVAYGNAALAAAVKLAEKVIELEKRLAAIEGKH